MSIRFCIIFTSFILLNNLVYGQGHVLRDTSLITAEQFKNLNEQYGKNKKIPPGFEKLALYTLSFFPELKNHRIEFKLRDEGAPLSSRPAWGTIFRSAGKRTYMVFLHSGKDSSDFGSIFRRATIPAQIGILGHELSHIVNFSKKTSMGLIGIGISHVSKPYMDRFEFYTDSLCIAHGLGYYQLEWAAMFDKMIANSGQPDPFKNKNTPTGERYMSAATIQDYMKKMGY
ncbi:MAG TPA: hypothetical protein VK166_00730 [Chitinophagaceae bacterium]|nr:hypothetical protein [Chitinophagaceae bacterium]